MLVQHMPFAGPNMKLGSLHETCNPVPVRGRGHRRPPLEARTSWDPWLPLQYAFPDIPQPLQTLAGIILIAIVGLSLLLLCPWLFG